MKSKRSLIPVWACWAVVVHHPVVDSNPEQIKSLKKDVTMIKNNTLRINRWLWLTITITLLIVGIAFVPAAAAQNSDAPQLIVVAAVVSVREGPDMTYPAIDYLWQGEQVTAIGYDAAGDWWEVALPSGESGWVNGWKSYVSVSGDTTQFLEPASSQIETVLGSSTTTVDNSQSGTIVFQTTSGGDIYAINADGTNLRYLTTGMDPAISPDGQWVAFTRWEGDREGIYGNVWLINIDGSGERVIHEYVLNPRSPTWSADGTKLIISWQQGGHPDPYEECGKRPPREAYDIEMDIEDDGDVIFCYTMPADPHWGLRIIDIATGAHEDLPAKLDSFSPALHPIDDQYLIYDSDDGMARDEGLAGLNLEAELTWDVTTDVNDHSPVFSPDGSKIAVSYLQHDHWEIHVMNADGSNRQRLTETSYITLVEQHIAGEESRSFNNAAPTWSPDGSQIAFLTDRTGRWEIWVMDADGSNQQPMFDNDVLEGLGLNYAGVDERMLSWQ
jgi:uncharacterized protein YraI